MMYEDLDKEEVEKPKPKASESAVVKCYVSCFHNYTPIYGSLISDCAVLLANVLVFFIGFQSLVRAAGDREECDAPLRLWLTLQLILVIALQIVPILLVPLLRETLFLESTKCWVAMPVLIVQLLWLFLGFNWIMGRGDTCQILAPNAWNAAALLLVVYTLILPVETWWYLFSESHLMAKRRASYKEIASSYDVEDVFARKPELFYNTSK